MDEDTWNDIPPPPPPPPQDGSLQRAEIKDCTLDVEPIDSLRNNDQHTLETNPDTKSIDVALFEGYTVGSDTLNAIGAADEALAFTVSQCHFPTYDEEGGDRYDASPHGCATTPADEEVDSFQATWIQNTDTYEEPERTESDEISSSDGNPLERSLTEDVSQKELYFNSNISVSESFEHSDNASNTVPQLLGPSQRIELFNYLKGAGVAMTSVNHNRELSCHMQTEADFRSEEQSKNRNTNGSVLSLTETRRDISTILDDKLPDCKRMHGITLDELAKLGEQKTMIQNQTHEPRVDRTTTSDIVKPNLSPNTETFLGVGFQEVREDCDIEPSSNNPKKKSFLRKGSRKEPSALQRKEQNTINGESIKTSSCTDLDKLEIMQQEQIYQLEQRVKRRETARNEQTRRNQQHLGGESSKQEEIISQKGYEDKETNESPPSVSTDSENEQRHDPRNNEISGDEDNNAVTPARKTCEPCSKDKENCSMPPIIMHMDPAKKRSPLKQSNGVARVNAKGNHKQYDEQWHAMKRMRRRQEVALREAERERETVRLIS